MDKKNFGLDVFEDILIYIVKYFEYFCLCPDSNVNRDSAAKAHCNIGCDKKSTWLYTSVTEFRQAKSNDIVKGFDWLINLFANVRHDIDEYHDKWYKKTLELAKKLIIVEVVARVCSRQMLRENDPSDSSSEYYKLSLTIPLADTVLVELKRRFEGNQTYVFSGFDIIPYYGCFFKKPCQKDLERPLQKVLKLLWKWFWRSVFTIIRQWT